MFKAAISIAETLNITFDGRPIGWVIARTGGEASSTLEQTSVAVSGKNVIGIVGPEIADDTHDVSRFAQRIGIPMVSYSATNPTLSDRRMYPNFYRTVPSDYSTALAIARLFQRYHWTSCILIYQNDASGWAGVGAISEVFEANGLNIKELIMFNVATMAVRGNLSRRLLNSVTRMIILWADSKCTSMVLERAATDDVLGPRFLWILRTSISLHSFTESFSQALVGMLSVEAVPGNVVDAPFNASLLTSAYAIWEHDEPQSFPGESHVDADALFAFDATWLLIQSLRELCSQMPDGSPRQRVNSTSLLEQIGKTKFLGVSGPVEYQRHASDRIGGIHYVVRNVQTSPQGLNFVATLKYSEPGQWQPFQSIHDVLWPGKSSKVPNDRPRIASVKLRIGVYQAVPFITKEYRLDKHAQNKSTITGYIPDLLDLLQQRMNFVPELIFVAPNITVPTLLNEVASGDYDMFISQVTVTSSRIEKVAFSTSIFDNSLRLIMRKPTPDHVELFSYLRPFSLSLWMAILATTICTSLLILLVERHDNDALRDRSVSSMGAMSFWYSLGNIMGYGVDYHVTTIAGRVLTVALYILSLVLVASYTANLASNLTISKTKNIINSIEDIKQGQLPYNRIGVGVGTASEDYFLREISGGSRSFYPVYSRQDIIRALLSGEIDASLIDSGAGEYIANTVYCNLTLVGPSFDASTFGIVFPKNWPYIHEFDVNILALRESGQLDKLRKRWFESNLCEGSMETPNAMDVASMAGLFLTVGILICVALSTFVWTRRMSIKQYLQGDQYNVERKNEATGR